ncbi:helix-turn-helix domain-containing protein [Saccharibacillus sp. CPCC 101409]|uniref:helix-turn-helix domain-containing protein n=1 Tax=Saccharibacillus sp. CPCC 101409 TaxID=3058041 RepID=UPI0026723796|nr:helix-turn-helix domain-containing protein [Saccharibacillus sp. CPCC 101409]MDO3413048.1 helix-turn-helix domain-containing protein [Saccharibacillus sp. CPCC 101409]
MPAFKEEVTRELQLVHRSYQTMEPDVRLFINTFEAFIHAQETLDTAKANSLLKFLDEIGALNVKTIVEEIISNQDSKEVFVPFNEGDPYLSVKEIALLSNVSQQMVRRACEEGKIEAVRGKKRSWMIHKQKFMDSELYGRWTRNKQDKWSILEQGAGAFTENKEFLEAVEQAEKDRKKMNKPK